MSVDMYDEGRHALASLEPGEVALNPDEAHICLEALRALIVLDPKAEDLVRKLEDAEQDWKRRQAHS